MCSRVSRDISMMARHWLSLTRLINILLLFIIIVIISIIVIAITVVVFFVGLHWNRSIGEEGAGEGELPGNCLEIALELL